MAELKRSIALMVAVLAVMIGIAFATEATLNRNEPRCRPDASAPGARPERLGQRRLMIQLHCDNDDGFRLTRVLISVLTNAAKRQIPNAHVLRALNHHGGTLTAKYVSAPSEALRRAVEVAWKEEHEVDVR